MILIQILIKEDVDDFLSSANWETLIMTELKTKIKIEHTRYPGRIDITMHKLHPRLWEAVVCDQDASKEWQILHSFIGRLADGLRDNIESISILFPD